MKKTLLVSLFLTMSLYINDSAYAEFTNNVSSYQNGVAVLLYHHIDPNESGLTISPQRFKEEMDALRDNGFHVISLSDFESFLKYGSPVPSNAVLITFDDGYESVYKYAYPILVDHGYTATTFIIVKDSENPLENPKLPFLSFDEMREMQKKGMTFQSHTYDQHSRDNLLLGPIYSVEKQDMETEGEYRKRVTDDLLLAGQKLERELGTKQNMLAFPHGEYNQETIELARKAGIDVYFTGDFGLTTRGNDLIPRIQAGVPYVNGSILIDQIQKAVKTKKPEGDFAFLAPNVKINGIEQDFPQDPIVRNGVSLVPLRQIAKGLGASLKWDQDNESIRVIKGDTTLSIRVGQNQAVVNGKFVTLEVPVQLVDNHVMVPTRWIVETLGGSIQWNPNENTIYITTAVED